MATPMWLRLKIGRAEKPSLHATSATRRRPKRAAAAGARAPPRACRMFCRVTSSINRLGADRRLGERALVRGGVDIPDLAGSIRKRVIVELRCHSVLLGER